MAFLDDQAQMDLLGVLKNSRECVWNVLLLDKNHYHNKKHNDDMQMSLRTLAWIVSVIGKQGPVMEKLLCENTKSNFFHAIK